MATLQSLKHWVSERENKVWCKNVRGIVGKCDCARGGVGGEG